MTIITLLCVIPFYPYLKAGIASANNPEQLLIALEPEAASIHCRDKKMKDFTSERGDAAVSDVFARPAAKYLVVDIGGNLTDVIAFSSPRVRGCKTDSLGLRIPGTGFQPLSVELTYIPKPRIPYSKSKFFFLIPDSTCRNFTDSLTWGDHPSSCDATSFIFCCIELSILIVRLSRSTSFSAHSLFKSYSRVKVSVTAVIYSKNNSLTLL